MDFKTDDELDTGGRYAAQIGLCARGIAELTHEKAEGFSFRVAVEVRPA